MNIFKRKFQYYLHVIFNIFIRIISTYIAKLKFFYWNVDFGEKFRIQGRIKLVNMNSITVAKNVRMISGFGNFVGGEMCLSLYCGQNGRIVIGENTGISNAVIIAQEKITIGKNVFIGGGSRIYDNDFHPHRSIDRLKDGEQIIPTKSIEIGDNVFIGGHTIILKGTIIGEGSIIGAGSIVSGTVPPYQVWAGNPAKMLREI
jgi:acetyltransferase-like isoleucine patch superfamily enzyme